MSDQIDNGIRADQEAKRPRRVLTDQQLIARIAMLGDTILRDLDALRHRGVITRARQLKSDTCITEAIEFLDKLPKV